MEYFVHSREKENQAISMREIDFPGIVFIYYNTPAFTST
jgi:hypothetical protein